MEEHKITYIDVQEPGLDFEEKLYLRAYVATLSHDKAYKVLNPSDSSVKNNVNKYMSRQNVLYHINKEMVRKIEALEMSPESILSDLYEEARFKGKGSQHGSRVQALHILGKQVGLFNDKTKDKEVITYNIINYNGEEGLKEQVAEEPKEIESKPEDFGVSVTKYEDSEDKPPSLNEDEDGYND